MKLEALDNFQIAKQFKNDNRFGGVLNKADLNKLENKCYVFNLDKKNGPGSHWTCLSNLNSIYVFYYDSFAGPPPEHVLKLMNMTGKKLIMNTRQLQEIDADSCGYWCILELKLLMQGKTPLEISNMFVGNLENHERILTNYFKHYPLL